MAGRRDWAMVFWGLFAAGAGLLAVHHGWVADREPPDGLYRLFLVMLGLAGLVMASAGVATVVAHLFFWPVWRPRPAGDRGTPGRRDWPEFAWGVATFAGGCVLVYLAPARLADD